MSIIPLKRCARCGVEKPLTEFHKQSSQKDGYRPACKQCRKQESKEYYWRDPELQRARMLERRKADPNYMRRYSREATRCAACGELKTTEDFSKDLHRKNRLSPYCRACCAIRREARSDANKELLRNWYAKFRDRVIQKSREWAKDNRATRRGISRRYSHRRRALVDLRGSYTESEWIALCEKYGYRCLRCGEQRPLTVDHIVPISKGGSNTIDNLQPLCQRCNASKNSSTVDYRY